MLHNPSFALGYILGQKTGGGTDDSAAMEFGGGDFCDIWTIPVYEQSDTVSHTDAMMMRGYYISDVIRKVYGGQLVLMQEGDNGVRMAISIDEYDGTERDTYSIIYDKPNTLYTANWATVPARLLVGPTLVAVILLDETNDMPVLCAGFMRQVRSLTSGQIKAKWMSVDQQLCTWPNNVDTAVTKINDFGEKDVHGYYRVRRYKGVSNTYENKNGWARNLTLYHSTKGLTVDSPIEHPFAMTQYTGPGFTYDFAGGAASFGSTFPAEETGSKATSDQYYMHITSYMDKSGRLHYVLLKLPQYHSSPTMRGLLPPDMCTYPHTAIDDTPGSWGQGYAEGKEDGYTDGYADGETAGKEAGRQEGYDEGHEDGYAEGQIAGYESGYAVGESAGYQYGYTAGETAGHEAGYSEGYDAGYAKGKADGYQEGYTAGETAGHDAGYSEGYEAGETAGHDAGYTEGYAAGETAGHEAGYSEGYTAGYNQGKTDGYQEGYEAGYQAGQQGETPQPPTDGKTHIAVNVGPIDRTMELLLVVHGPAVVEGEVQILGTMDVDWGEGADSYQVISPGETKTLTLTHEYMQAGDYDVVITGTNVTIELGHGASNGGLLGQTSSVSVSVPIIVKSVTIGNGVIEINDYALQNLRSMVSIYIPDGVTVGRNAMSYCYALAHVRLPADMTELPQYCFRDCAALRSIELPDTITTMGNYAVAGCTSLEKFSVPPMVAELPTFLCYENSALAEIVIPAGVTNLGARNIASTQALDHVTLPASIVELGSYAFENAYGLRWVRLLSATPPTTSQYTFSNMPSGVKFIVPNGSGDTYRTATRWKTYAARIFEESEVNW